MQKRTASLPWDDLRCVLAIARTGSLSGAARAMHVGHSTVFRRLNALERRLGVKLFDRSRGGYAPTAHGTQAAAAASVMESQALAVEASMIEEDSDISGVVRLATSELLAGHLLPRVLRSFFAAHPRIEVEIDVANHAVDLTRREADLALRASNDPGDHLVGREIAELRYAIYAARDLVPQGAAEVPARMPWLGFDDSIAHHEVARWLKTRRPHVTPRVRFSSIASMVQATAEGLGVSILPMFAAYHDPALARIGAVLDEPRMKLWIVNHPELRGNARVRALSRHLAHHLPPVLAQRQDLRSRNETRFSDDDA